MPKALIAMKKFIPLIFFFIANIGLAQNRTYRLRADQAYADKDYVTAAYYYDKALQGGTITTQGTVPYFSTPKNKKPRAAEVAYITYRLAESYRLYQNLTLAEESYKQVVDNYLSIYPMARFWYAICLRSNNHVNEAVSNLQLFIDANKNNKAFTELGNRELNNSRFAKLQMDTPTLTKVIKLDGNFNNNAGDFGLTANNGKYWFTSSRYGAGEINHLNRIYTGDSTGTKTRLDLGFDLKTNVQYGTPSLEESGKRMYFTVWYTDRGNTKAAIYLSRNIDHKWQTPQKLNVNVNAEGYNAMQPCVTADGKHLYFASNKPGGQGGTDIWVSELDIEGLPLYSTNLGSTVNTPEDEQAPFYDEKNHKLVYSSKGFVGMGGFDLFESIDTNKHFTTPKNLGCPFNSTKDDLYYYPDNRDNNVVYISSDRESECCLNLLRVNVYRPKPKPKPKPIPPVETAMLSGLVIDCATSKPLAGVSASLVDSLSREIVNFTTDEAGKYQFKLIVKHSYVLKLEKTDYFTKIIYLPAVTSSKKDTLFNPVICQQHYVVNKPIVINNILYDFNKYVLKPESKLVLDDLVTILKDNPNITVELSSHTDSFGPDWYNNRLSQQRAQSCVNYIISKGISRSRITARGYGATMPIAPNKLPDGHDNIPGRKLNRRTEFKVLK
jgi:outer membrane protein OmpA-like peptidoglycan-associated protein/tetratricopeptide (TPR) repeat protein